MTRVLGATLALVLLSAGCKADPPTVDPPTPEVVLAEATEILTADTVDLLTSATPDRVTLVFEGESTQLASVQPGSVLVSTIHDNLPAGMLRKVVEVQRAGGQTVITTEPAGLTDAIERGSLQARIVLTADSARAVGPDAIVVGFNDRVVYDADESDATTHDQVRVDGSLAVDPEIVIDIDISGFSLDRATVELQAVVETNLTVEADRQAHFADAIPLTSIPFRPIVFFVGPLPVVLEPSLNLEMTVDGTVTAGMTTSLQTEIDATAGFGYANGSFGPVFELDPSATLDFSDLTPGASGDARVGLGARFDVAAYGMAGVFVRVEPYSRYEMDTLGDPWWSVYAGAEGSAGAFAALDVNALFFDIHIDIFEYETDPLSFEFLVDAADGAAPPLESLVDEISWGRTYGGSSNDHLVTLLALPDGGLLAGGGTASFTGDEDDTLLLRLDRLGNVAWSEVLPDLGAATGLTATPTGFLAVAGSVGLGADVVSRVELDENGLSLATIDYSADRNLAPHALVTASDGSHFVVGTAGSFDTSDAWVTKLSALGDVLWSKRVGGSEGERANSAVPTSTGGLVVAASTESFGATFNGTYVFELDANGLLVTQSLYDGPSNEWPRQLVRLSSGDLVVVGDDGDDAFAIRLTPSGSVVWSKRIDGGTDFDNAVAATPLIDDKVFATGTRDLGSAADVWAFRLDSSGDLDWSTSLAGPDTDESGGRNQYADAGSPAVVGTEGGLYLAATSESFAPEWADAWVIRLTSTGQVDFNVDPQATSTNLSGQSSPLTLTRQPVAGTVEDLPLTAVPSLTPNTSVELDSLLQGGPGE